MTKTTTLFDQCVATIERLEAEKALLVEALVWYSDDTNWDTRDGEAGPVVGWDCGARAREALTLVEAFK